jgi:hypothetical protein
LAPVHPPEALQEVASVEDHCKVVELPDMMLVGLAESATVGATVNTITVTPFEVVPPVPVQVRE